MSKTTKVVQKLWNVFKFQKKIITVKDALHKSKYEIKCVDLCTHIPNECMFFKKGIKLNKPVAKLMVLYHC